MRAKEKAAKAYDIRSSRRLWLGFQVSLPLTIMLLIIPLFSMLVRVNNPVSRSLGEGDLILFSATLMLAISCELHRLQKTDSNFQLDDRVDLTYVFALFWAVILFLVFAAIKILVMQNEYFKGQKLSTEALAIVAGSMAALFGSTAYCFRVVTQVSAKQLKLLEGK